MNDRKVGETFIARSITKYRINAAHFYFFSKHVYLQEESRTVKNLGQSNSILPNACTIQLVFCMAKSILV